MRKRAAFFFILCLIPVFFIGCTSGPDDELASLMRHLSALEDYTFVAVGELIQEAADGDEARPGPLRYAMEGARARQAQQFSAQIRYADLYGTTLYDMTLLQAGGGSYITFVPLFQYVLDFESDGAYSMEDAFGGSPYLLHPTEDAADVLVDLHALLSSLDAEALRENLAVDAAGTYTLSLAGGQLNQDVLTELTQPFALFSDVWALKSEEGGQPGLDAVLGPLFAGDVRQYTLDLVFAYDAEENGYTAWLTLTAPGLMTVTADVSYRPGIAPPITPPFEFLEVEEMREILSDYYAAHARATFLAESGLEIIHDLPELHMTDHLLDTALLLPHETYIDGIPLTVSVLANDNTTDTGDRVFSFSWSMSLRYTTLDAFTASETIALFVLDALSVEDFDGENHQRTALRINAHDTAAVNALFYDDNHTGRTLILYVLQNIEDTDRALFLCITILLDRLAQDAPHRAALERLGFYIGIDFLQYVDMAGTSAEDS